MPNIGEKTYYNCCVSLWSRSAIDIETFPLRQLTVPWINCPIYRQPGLVDRKRCVATRFRTVSAFDTPAAIERRLDAFDVGLSSAPQQSSNSRIRGRSVDCTVYTVLVGDGQDCIVWIARIFANLHTSQLLH